MVLKVGGGGVYGFEGVVVVVMVLKLWWWS